MLTVLIIVLAALFVAVRLAIPRLGEPVAGGVIQVDGQARLAACPDSPNCVNSMATDPAQQVRPISYSRPDSEVISTLADWLRRQDRVTVVKSDSDYLHATFRTAMMGFTDDVEFLRQPGGSLQVRSASRLGRSDLGANRKRVESLRSSLQGVI